MTEFATFAAGCFWGIEETFRQAKGVSSTIVGYAGGATANPTYEEVCTGTTGHAEVVRVEYNPNEISFDDLLKIFWACHDPTQLDRQGPDVGTQYRSEVFFHNDAQQGAARTSLEKEQQSGRHATAIVTKITPASAFFRAEEYHQQFFEKRSMANQHY